MATVARNRTVLKWVGSKVGVIEQLRQHLPNTKRLVEPFAGSCAVMMNTDYEQYLVGDINQDLISFYLHMQENRDNFISSLKEVFVDANDREVFIKRRSDFNYRVWERSLESDCYLLQCVEYYRATLFLYLNRHCFNGLCRYNSKGEFNVPFGKYKQPYYPEKEINIFVEKSQKVKFSATAWQKTLNHVVRGDGIYCDPPYLNTFSRYNATGFSAQEHEDLAKSLSLFWTELDVPSTISNSIDAKEMYLDMGFTVYEITAPRSVSAKGSRKSVTEIIAVLGGH